MYCEVVKMLKQVHPIFNSLLLTFFYLFILFALPMDRNLTLTSTGRFKLPKFKGSVFENQL